MAIDTKDKRLNVTNITLRTHFGLTPTGSVDQNDKENYAWYYIPFAAPLPVVGEAEQFKYNIGPTVGPGM